MFVYAKAHSFDQPFARSTPSPLLSTKDILVFHSLEETFLTFSNEVNQTPKHLSAKMFPS